MFDLGPALSIAQDAIEANLAEFFRAGQYILGPQTAAFEGEFARTIGADYVVGVGSGTSALELCLRDAGLTNKRCEVIVPAMTSMFTAHAVLAVGASLRVADVCPETLLPTPETLERAAGPDTRAVIAVHLYGQPCDLTGIARVCASRGWVLIQDACQAHGARFKGLGLTEFSPYCAYSFYPTKNLGALGDGGAVATSDPNIAERIRRMRDGGRCGDQISRGPGLNSRLDELQACYLRAFLPWLGVGNERRRQIAQQYRQDLRGNPAVQLVAWNEDSVHHLLVARCPRRDDLREFLLARGIQTGVHYPVPIHEQPGLRTEAAWGEEPTQAARAAREIVSLPIGPHMTDAMVTEVVEGVWQFSATRE
jgi:dTDP-3-amino-3,4,6-trideoxy-alpha-D-glucose transaminase